LKGVADAYPNSAAAPQAMAAAAAYEEQSDYRHAASTLRQAYAEYGDTADKPRLLEAMARNYLAMPDRTADRVDTAAARLSSAVKLGAGATPLSKPLALPGQKVLAEAGVTLNDALKAVQNYKTQAVTARLPAFRLADMGPYHKAFAAWNEAAMEAADDAEGVDGADANAKAKSAKKPGPAPIAPEPFVPADRRLVIADVEALIKPPLDLRQRFARHDRVVAWTTASDLAIYPVGAAQPVGRSSEFTAPPRNVVWLEDGTSALVWGLGELALLSGDDAHPKWKTIRLKSLPRIEVVTGGTTDENPTVAAGADPQADAQQQQKIAINRRFGGRRAFINPAQLGVPVVAQAAPVPAGPEAISSVRPVDDKVIVATTAGQLFAIRVADGTLAWHTRLSAAAPITRLAATDDFTVARVDEGATTQLVIVETLTGQLLRRIAFGTNDAGGGTPVNFALAPDGMLVWTLPDRLCGKDLFEPRKELTYEAIAGPVDNRNVNVAFANAQQQQESVFGGGVNPDQLLISEGRVVAVTHGGRYVSLYSLETGKLLDYPQPDGKRAEARFSTLPPLNPSTTPTSHWAASIHLVGSKLYVCTKASGPVCYNLDKGGVAWGGILDQPTVPIIQYQEPFIGQDYVIVLNRPNPRPGAQATNNIVRLNCYSRATSASGAESGKVEHTPTLRDDAGIAEFQPVDGGLYYVTADKKLHYLQGAGAAKQ
jgi:hypothetical protein